MAAIKRDELPPRVVSPGAACAVLGITRQSMHQLCKRGVLPSWYADRVILIDLDAVHAYARTRLERKAQCAPVGKGVRHAAR
jgi:hypothetical protein